jgi:hypothetical protein
VWSLLAQSDVNPTAVAALVSAVGGIVLGAISLWRARNSDQRDEVSKLRNEVTNLWDANGKLRVDQAHLYDEVDGLRRAVRACEDHKSELARQLAEVMGQ